MSVGQRILAAMRALAILGLIWGILAAVGYFADVLPEANLVADGEGDVNEGSEDEPSGLETPDDSDTEGTEVAGATGTEDGDETGSEMNAEVEVAVGDPIGNGEPEPDTNAADPNALVPVPNLAIPIAPNIPPPPDDSAAPRLAVCGPVEHAFLSTIQVVGDARPELVVACEREVHVLGQLDGRNWMRVARITLAGDGPTRPARPIAGDIDGDGRDDLLLGFTELDAEGGPSGGALVLIPGNERGGFGEINRLAPISPITIITGHFDDRDGLDIVAGHWTDGFGRRPSEVWVFGGGPSPSRITRRRLDGEVVALATADLDLDGDLDIVAIDGDGVQRLDGDGTGRFPRAHSTGLLPARRLVSGDLNGDGHDDILVAGDTLTLLIAGEAEPTPIDGPHNIREVLLADVNGDSTLDIILLTRQRLVALVNADGRFIEQQAAALPPTFRPLDIASTGSELVILARTANGIELSHWPLIGDGVISDMEATPIPNSPMLLDLAVR